MALNKITYTDKVALNPQPSVADENKCTDSDLNQIKSVVNAGIDMLNIFNIEEIPLTLSTSGSNILINMNLDMLTVGILIIQGFFVGNSDIYISGIVNYGTRYAAEIIGFRGTNINNSQVSLQNSGNTIQLPCTANVPTGIGSVKAYLIQI